jgi:hypothetical protein
MPERLMLILSACVCLLLAVACGDDDGGLANPSAGGDRPGSSSAPTLTQPVSRFAISLEDLVPKTTGGDTGGGYLTDIQSTFKLDIRSYAGTRSFDSAAEGESLLTKWNYTGGYETGFEPETRLQGVLNGAYYINVEVHLFQGEDGSRALYKHFEDRLSKSGSKKVTAPPVGNESSAWKLVTGKVNDSSIDAAYHRIVFRRGNLVAVVQTWGSDPLMTVDTVRQLSALVDDKAMGKSPAIEPTPVPTQAAQPVPTAAK